MLIHYIFVYTLVLPRFRVIVVLKPVFVTLTRSSRHSTSLFFRLLRSQLAVCVNLVLEDYLRILYRAVLS